MHFCVVYDCLYPWTVGGGERWYRALCRRLVEQGHEVTYLTLTQWEAGEEPEIDGLEVVPVGPRMALYGSDGNRRILPPLRFGAGVLRHLWAHGDRYDVVHTAAFPYFSLLAAGIARRRRGFAVGVDWFEVWSRAYWREYLGEPGGAVGWAVQAACTRVPQRAHCFSELHRDRLLAIGLRGDVAKLDGMLATPGATGAPGSPSPAPDPPHFVFAGRHIAEKRVPALVPALALARQALPALRATILGDGPDRPLVLDEIRRHGLGDVIDAPGFVDAATVEATVQAATAVVLPSRREGYGLIVVEAASAGVPVVVVAGEDNAATELVSEGTNGTVSRSAALGDLAEAMVRVHRQGGDLRARTAAWFAENAERLSLERSVETALAGYAHLED